MSIDDAGTHADDRRPCCFCDRCNSARAHSTFRNALSDDTTPARDPHATPPALRLRRRAGKINCAHIRVYVIMKALSKAHRRFKMGLNLEAAICTVKEHDQPLATHNHNNATLKCNRGRNVYEAQCKNTTYAAKDDDVTPPILLLATAATPQISAALGEHTHERRHIQQREDQTRTRLRSSRRFGRNGPDRSMVSRGP